MDQEPTTLAVQRILDDLGAEVPSEAIVRALLERSACRLRRLCVLLLSRSYPRLTQPPLNLEAEELLSAVVERLMKALREAKPTGVREYFAMAGQHMRWELNDLARRLDERPAMVELHEEFIPSPGDSGSALTMDGRRMFRAIDDLPDDEREVFDLVRIQGLTMTEAARILGVSESTAKRRLRKSLAHLAEVLDDLRPAPLEPSE
ncbi:sigma-70 family RNA polymerase sigma factor [Singulisphaera sp. PoT]|uniref:sigma-70 family RNA polymerase sigma factor n=1 Tax=Singulisphaera sp. PoT TaxID=3411797 RepID=UPI003BF5D594